MSSVIVPSGIDQVNGLCLDNVSTCGLILLHHLLVTYNKKKNIYISIPSKGRHKIISVLKVQL